MDPDDIPVAFCFIFLKRCKNPTSTSFFFVKPTGQVRSHLNTNINISFGLFKHEFFELVIFIVQYLVVYEIILYLFDELMFMYWKAYNYLRLGRQSECGEAHGQDRFSCRDSVASYTATWIIFIH